MSQKSKEGPIRSLDLEKWRTKHGLTISAACELLGLQRATWAELQKTPSKEVEDATVCALLTLYERFPETMPITRVIDIRQRMVSLGYDPDNPKDKKSFAGATGREAAAVYRWVNGQGNVSKPVERLLEALDRLHTESGKKKRSVLESVAMEVADRAGVRDPLSRGSWRRES
ncbi:hypothetical protein [Paraburkholderia hospita]|uniref:hypothetical protein n=1 Tax=Paraburkholderia hospita TaxID=169430 RepID=UPI0008A80B62|nr:hypothetical protein [Paraburkholderia hospita]SEI14355.1 hypothetical protein SAMN05192544_102514 [Paraburkholderia hospita]